jgi:hypothetical protein
VGVDSVCLFDKRLCDEILSLSEVDLASFLQPRLSALGELTELRCEFDENVPAEIRFRELRDRGRTEGALKFDLVADLCVSKERINLDYWACYAEVFSEGPPPGSISSMQLFPDSMEESYLLLLPEHIERMLASLDLHRSEVSAMTGSHIAQLRRWRDQCASDPGLMLAYFYDY